MGEIIADRLPDTGVVYVRSLARGLDVESLHIVGRRDEADAALWAGGGFGSRIWGGGRLIWGRCGVDFGFLGLRYGRVRIRSQFGGPLGAETLELVHGAVESALEAGFLAAERGDSVLVCVDGHAGESVAIELFFRVQLGEVFPFFGEEGGFGVVEPAEAPHRHG